MDWKDRISGDSWKNVIMLECQKVEDKGWNSLRPGLQPPKPDRLTKTNLQKIALDYEVVKSSGQFAQSYLVWQTGRLFVVGPTKEAARRIERLQPKHLHIVLLNWDRSHRDSIHEFLSRPWDKETPWSSVTIWTSYWIWEETLSDLEQGNDKLLQLKFFDPSPASERPHEWAGAMFERSVVWDLTCGVSLAMSYSVASQPYLRAEFRCNNRKIAIDPALDWLWGEKADMGKWKEGAGNTNILTDQFRSLYLEIVSKSERKEPEEYRDEALSRYQKLLERYQRLDRSAGRWSLDDPKDDGFEYPVDLTPNKELFKQLPSQSDPIAETTPRNDGEKNHQSGPLSSQGDPISSQGDPTAVNPDSSPKQILAKTAVVILCGGLMNKAERELIDPGYELDIKIEGEASERMAILEWRLHQLNQWVRGIEGFKLPILLLTTPETENIVDGCCKRYKKRYENPDDSSETDRLELKQVATQLIPWVKDHENPTEWFETDDGGWQLSPRGHMDCLRILAQQKENGEEWLKEKEFAIIFAFNNLGDVINKETCENLGKLAEATKADLAVEVFEYQKNLDDSDSRWPQLSYCTDPYRPRLLKSSYNRPAAPGDKGTYYSSLTWYVKLKKLGGPEDFDAKTSGPKFVLRRTASEEAKVFGQDIDLITCLSEIRVLGLPSPIPKDQPPSSPETQPPSSLYWYPRYLGVRTQDHIRHIEFGEKFKDVGKLDGPFSPSGPQDNEKLPFPPIGPQDNKRPPLLISWPKHQEYVWGGHEIATLKGLPGIYREMRIAETWEVSTHERDQSQIMLNANNKVSLREVLGGQHLGFMAKYLDCHGSLSLQVHPSHATGSFLCQNLRFRLRDKAGKEESFFVLKKAPGNRVCLFLGFDRTELRPLAERIRPRMESASERKTVTDGDLDDIWKSLLSEVKKQCQGEIAKRLFQGEPAEGERLVGRVFSSREGDEQLKILKYHLGASSQETHCDASRILGKEYLFAAVAIIDLIRKLKEFVEETRGSAPDGFMERAGELFGKACLAPEPVRQEYLREHPLLRFFHRAKIPADDYWVRIPPGTLHAWQGGGNFLIELGHRSDNTFRILDYGREISDYPRDMHYEEAMYALNDNGFFDDQAGERLIVAREPGESPCDAHALLGCQVYSSANRVTIETEGDWSFLMNPDGDMSLIARGSGESFRCRTSVRRCRTVLIERGMKVEVQPEQPDNRILHFFKRKRASPLLCLCLGGTRWYAGLWQDEDYPPVDWCSLDVPGNPAPEIEALLEQAHKKLKWRDIQELHVGISWPGYVDSENNKLYSSQLGTKDRGDLIGVFNPHQVVESYILSDFQAALLGEIHHPLGRLNPNIPGALINIGSGICVAFYLPGAEEEVFKDNRIIVCSGVGRWLYVSLKTGELKRADDLFPQKPGELQELVFGSAGTNCHGEWVRASKYFSAAGIVARHQVRVGGPLLDDFETELDSLGCESVAVLHDRLRNIEIKPRDVANFAIDLAGLVQQVEMMLEDRAKSHGGKLTDAQFTKVKEDCLRNIVLTGQVGQYFDVAGASGGEDLLVEAMKQRLGKGYEVKRSEIGVAAEREADGFVYYRSLRKRLDLLQKSVGHAFD